MDWEQKVGYTRPFRRCYAQRSLGSTDGYFRLINSRRRRPESAAGFLFLEIEDERISRYVEDAQKVETSRVHCGELDSREYNHVNRCR